MIYNSEFCNEKLSYLTDDMSFEEFASLSDKVMYYTDRKLAAEKDQEAERNRQEAISKAQRG